MYTDGRPCYIPARAVSDRTRAKKCGASPGCEKRLHGGGTEFLHKRYALLFFVSFFGETLMTQQPGRGFTQKRWPVTPPSRDAAYSQVTVGVLPHNFWYVDGGNFSDYMMSFLLLVRHAAWFLMCFVYKQDVMSSALGVFIAKRNQSNDNFKRMENSTNMLKKYSSFIFTLIKEVGMWLMKPIMAFWKLPRVESCSLSLLPHHNHN